MYNSIRSLRKAPYNRNHFSFALTRLFYWKLIKLFKWNDLKYNLWDDRKIYLNHDSLQCMWLMYNYIVDWEEFNLIQDYVQASDHIADVGTNMGYYTIWMSKFIGDEGAIHAFEPDQNNFNKLIQNCELNNLKNVKCNKIALAEIDGTLYFTDSLDGLNHISSNESPSTTEVVSQKFDTYSELNKIDKLELCKS